MVMDLNETYRMMRMMMMVMIMMMKTRNGHNLANFEATFSRFGMVIGCNNTYRLMMMTTTMMMMMIRMIKPKMAMSQSILKLQPPDFAW